VYFVVYLINYTATPPPPTVEEKEEAGTVPGTGRGIKYVDTVYYYKTIGS
jgi:hypothetical protein